MQERRARGGEGRRLGDVWCRIPAALLFRHGAACSISRRSVLVFGEHLLSCLHRNLDVLNIDILTTSISTVSWLYHGHTFTATPQNSTTYYLARLFSPVLSPIMGLYNMGHHSGLTHTMPTVPTGMFNVVPALSQRSTNGYVGRHTGSPHVAVVYTQ